MDKTRQEHISLKFDSGYLYSSCFSTVLLLLEGCWWCFEVSFSSLELLCWRFLEVVGSLLS